MDTKTTTPQTSLADRPAVPFLSPQEFYQQMLKRPEVRRLSEKLAKA